MAEKADKILLAHGSGGRLSHELVGSMVLRELSNPILLELGDSAVIESRGSKLAFTTDSHTVKPLFFPGGDIWRLSVFGTVNDLAAAGAKPLYLSLALIIEEGLELSVLSKVIRSIRAAAEEAGVAVVAGDTKVVEKGSGDGLFTNTSGIGTILEGVALSPSRIEPGDRVLVTGTVGDHGAAVLSERQGLGFSSLRSDCAPLWGLVAGLFDAGVDVKFMRDPTRGGLATVLNEAVHGRGVGIRVWEAEVPVREEVRAFCEVLDLDPLYIANEGKMVVAVAAKDAERALSIVRAHPLGREAAVIDEAVSEPKGRVYLTTRIQGTRVLDMLVGEQFPRIC